MKKLFYILLITFVSSLAFTSCTEEEVKPNLNSGNTSNGSGSDKM